MTMNRDESRLRHEEGVLVSSEDHVYPKDQRAGGSWFGLNSFGLAMGLLNNYQAPHAEGDLRSRGFLIPQFLQSCRQIEDVVRALRNENISQFNPFHLIITDGEFVQSIDWDRQGLEMSEIQEVSRHIWTSSGVRLPEIKRFREAKFMGFAHTDAASIIRELHLWQDQNAQGDSILMDRDVAHTKSVCQIALGQSDVSLSYWPETILLERPKDLPAGDALHWEAIRKPVHNQTLQSA